MKTIKSVTIPSEEQIDFVKEQQDQDFKEKLLLQNALSAVIPLSKVSMLELLKAEIKSPDHDRGYHTAVCLVFRKCISYFDMTEEEQTKINDYLNS